MDNASDIRIKESALVERIKAAGKLAVAFSGGVDSTYLLYKAHEVLGDDAIAVTVKSQVLTSEDLSLTSYFCEKTGVKQTVISFDVFSVEEFAANPPDRCYYCKRKIFESIANAAEGYVVADGSNVDDDGDYRPGIRALKELGIVSPLKEAGLTKNDIRLLSKEAGILTWDKPSAACLASRFAYGEKITTEGLIRVANAEKFINDLGFSGIRVRVHGDIARIEAAPDDIALLTYERTRKEISAELKRLGFKYVTIDIDGYRTGSMNEVL
ncbi:MAG: ATP-dependent sacrificial sulfur transferase LarE [Saccharofermentans sp.]|nr:ATP-dependent sacrificial sulfur transferase LarE [Saccharofermentans sp.]